jgi:hypothetical protein
LSHIDKKKSILQDRLRGKATVNELLTMAITRGLPPKLNASVSEHLAKSKQTADGDFQKLIEGLPEVVTELDGLENGEQDLVKSYNANAVDGDGSDGARPSAGAASPSFNPGQHIHPMSMAPGLLAAGNKGGGEGFGKGLNFNPAPKFNPAAKIQKKFQPAAEKKPHFNPNAKKGAGNGSQHKGARKGHKGGVRGESRQWIMNDRKKRNVCQRCGDGRRKTFRRPAGFKRDD